MPRSSRERTIAIVFISFLVLLAAWVIWQLLIYYSQPGEVRVAQSSVPAYTPLRSATPVRNPATAAVAPVRNPQAVTITKPISIAVQYGSVSVLVGAKLPFVSRATRFASATPTVRTTKFQFRPQI